MTPAQRDELERRIREHHEAGRMDEAATVALRGYGPELLGFLVGMHRDGELAGEIFAAFSEDLWRGLPRFAWQSSFRTWAYVLARHASHRQLRDPRHRRVQRLHTEQLAGLVEEVRDSTALHLRTTMKDGIARLRESLALDDRAMLVLRIDRGLGWHEIARVLDAESLGESPEDAAVARAAARLRKRFERVKAQLRTLARAHGLLGRTSDADANDDPDGDPA